MRKNILERKHVSLYILLYKKEKEKQNGLQYWEVKGTFCCNRQISFKNQSPAFQENTLYKTLAPTPFIPKIIGCNIE